MKGTRTATRIVIDWSSGYAGVMVIDDGAVRAPTIRSFTDTQYPSPAFLRQSVGFPR
ncbi:MAG: hypothetical protein AVDCRST_MAG93-7286 [uncultured Chloroflexia bacterium]|uniref:Uncharacterized protein n=1 Tax=uncultured Chloroflexia bacterium TaxID=1672391 RepID=A0A6J4MC83_9CHLR|nr:MAG: hypothetical protein AVDCRST_MAG93-7286 [uncultured Chloroflexia bacterium]